MVYAIEMFFDIYSEKKIINYFHKLSELKISSYLVDVKSTPHITLGIYQDIEIEKSFSVLNRICKDTDKFNLMLSSVGVFTYPKPCVYLSPVVNQELLSFHQKTFNDFSFLNSKGFEYYAPSNWVPHCAIDISNDLNVIRKSTDYLLQNFTPFDITIEKIGWVEINKPVKQLVTFDLK